MNSFLIDMNIVKIYSYVLCKSLTNSHKLLKRVFKIYNCSEPKVADRTKFIAIY